MKVLVIGSGGREHALAWKLKQSPRVSEVIVAPGNAGTARERGVRNAEVAMNDLDGLLALARAEKIELTVVGPEVPLVAGVVDRFRAAGLRIFGPRAIAAQLEGSKAFAKDFLLRHNIPTARYAVFNELNAALAYVRQHGAPIVIKADGLAAGKGVVVALTLADAEQALHDMLGGRAFGNASARVVIEEFLEGEEASFIVMVDGRHVLPLATSQDHKRLLDADRGPNTGGMGAYSPAPVLTPALHARAMREVIMPVVTGMEAQGEPYTGFLYAGLMITPDQQLKVLEFNCRLGDPETQPIMMRLKSDLFTLVEHAINGQLHQVEAQWDRRVALGVVLAAAGYPEHPRKGDEITGLPRPEDDVRVFHAGTSLVDGRVLTSGGRVLCVTALGDTVRFAQRRAYEVAERIQFDGRQMRRDIGYRAIDARRSPL
jgi:phosphoribosylamine--glycine ligase